MRYHKNDLEIFNYSALEENLLKNSFFGLRTGGRSPKQKNFLASGDQHGDEFVIHNCENNHYYVVPPNHLELSERCECADCHYRSVKCKHQIAVENFLGQRLRQVLSKSIKLHLP